MKKIQAPNTITIPVLYDVVICGGGPAGLSAAICAAESGSKVLLVERNSYLGGSLAIGLSPLSFLDKAGKPCVGGFAQRFMDALQQRGYARPTEICPKHNSATCVNAEGVKLLAFEWCKKSSIDVLLHCETLRVDVHNEQISSVTLIGKCQEIVASGKVFIDCTGDGDMAYLAGCSYEKGQAGSGVLQPPTVMFTLEGVDQEKLFDYVEKNPLELRYNDAQIYENPDYTVEHFRKRPGHVFVGLQQSFAKWKAEGRLPVERTSFIYINGTNPGEVYVNSIRMTNVDASNIFDLTRAEMEGALQIPELIKLLKENIPGFEKCHLAAIAPSLGVRETRRFTGMKRVTENDALNAVVPPDSICLAGYKIDIHSGTGNGLFFKDIIRPFGIPYGALVSSEIKNLLFAGRCISCDAVAFGALRVIPNCMAMGEAAGRAAALSAASGVDVAHIDVKQLREQLLQNGSILEN